MTQDPITRRTVLRTTGAAALGAATLTGAASAHSEPCDCCVFLGKADRTPRLGDVYEFEYDGQTVTIEVTDVRTEDGEVVAAEFFASSELYKVAVKGGPNTRTCSFGSGVTGFWASAPAHEKNRNRTRYEISNVQFWLCLRGEDCPG